MTGNVQVSFAEVVDDFAPAIFESGDTRAGVQGLLGPGPREFRDKVVSLGR